MSHRLHMLIADIAASSVPYVADTTTISPELALKYIALSNSAKDYILSQSEGSQFKFLTNIVKYFRTHPMNPSKLYINNFDKKVLAYKGLHKVPLDPGQVLKPDVAFQLAPFDCIVPLKEDLSAFTPYKLQQLLSYVSFGSTENLNITWTQLSVNERICAIGAGAAYSEEWPQFFMFRSVDMSLKAVQEVGEVA